MEPSEQVHEQLWHGRIPVVFSLHPSEVTTLHAPRPFYALIPRQSFLVSQTRAVVEYFRDAAPPMSHLQHVTVWFAAEGKPLQWHQPFGLLWDKHVGATSGKAQLPWRLSVHFQGFPTDEVAQTQVLEVDEHDWILVCENEQSVEMHFMHSLKQATFLRTGSTKAIMNMPEAQQSQIWTSVTHNDYRSYRDATSALQLREESEMTASLRLVPVRVHLDKGTPIQMPIAPLQNGQERSLLDVLSTLLPDLFPRGSSSAYSVLIQGVAVPTSVSIVTLYRHFVYPDGFLYIYVASEA